MLLNILEQSGIKVNNCIFLFVCLNYILKLFQ